MDNRNDEYEAIKAKKKWENLPIHIKNKYNNNEAKWKEFVVNYSISHQIPYSGNLSSYVAREEAYLRDLTRYSCANLMVYPYHLQHKIVRMFNTTPFVYYLDMISDQVIKEKSYDTIPNFTAADCLQLLGIGRNQYIEIMMKNRSNKWGLLRKSVRDILPSTVKMWDSFEPWWIVKAGSILVSDVDNCTPDEKKVIDDIIDTNGAVCDKFDRQILIDLFKKNLLILDVPVDNQDSFIVPKLESFVMNRVQGDYMETLMYKVFVSLDENTSLPELALLLDIDFDLIKHSVSLLCRLGMICKKLSYGSLKLHPSWNAFLKENSSLPKISTGAIFEPQIKSSIIERLTCDESSIGGDSQTTTDPGAKRIGFIYDSTLTAFLMVGNLSQELKQYAMTMFEIGKVTSEIMEDFMKKLSDITVQNEGEAKRYYIIAMNLLSTLRFLREKYPTLCELSPKNQNKRLKNEVDMIHNESLKNLSRQTMLKLLKKRYIMLVSMAPLSNTISPVGCSVPPFFGPPITEFNSFWYRLYMYDVVKCGPPSILVPHGYFLEVLPNIFSHFELLIINSPDQSPLIIPKINCIHIINEALKYSFVFVQGYAYDQEIKNRLLYLPFPFEEGICKIFDSKNPEFLPRLTNNLNLEYGFGYITMIKHEKKESLTSKIASLSECIIPQSLQSEAVDSESAEITDSNYESRKLFYPDDIKVATSNNAESLFEFEKFDVIPFDISYGIPLFCDELNSRICDKIYSSNLFSPDNSKNFIKNNRRIILKLIDYIHTFNGSGFAFSEQANLLINDNHLLHRPTKPIMFSEGRTDTWSIHCEL